jgi:putative endonuclease
MSFFLCHAPLAGHPGGSRRNMNSNPNYQAMRHKEYRFYVYILASKKNGTLYIGVTNSLFGRIFRHKLKENPKSFTARYNVTKLVYFEICQYIQAAIKREKQLKKLTRAEKIDLIEKENSAWRDLFDEMG